MTEDRTDEHGGDEDGSPDWAPDRRDDGYVRDVPDGNEDELEFLLDDSGHPAAEEPDEPGVTAGTLLSDAIGRLRESPDVVRAMLLAGVLVAVVDALRRGDPVPIVGYEGLQTGEVSIAWGFMVNVVSRASTPPSALVDLRPIWLVRTVWLDVIRWGAVVLASVYGFARLLEVRMTAATTGRYLLAFAFFGVTWVDFDLGLVFGGVIILLFLVVLVRLSAFPGLIVAGESITGGLRRSWRLTKGHGWSLFGVVLVVGLANHALGSAPVVGPLGSSLAGALHVAVVVAFLDRVDAVDATTGASPDRS